MSDRVYHETCPDCEGSTSCCAVHPKSALSCTRSAGHSGQHVACGSQHAVARWEGSAKAAAPTRKEGASNEAQVRREALLSALRRAAVPLGEWARACGYDEKVVRGDVGSLRRLGHLIRAIGAGRFALEETKSE